jgi:hypothetical protein
MGKTPRDPELMMVASTQSDSSSLAKRRRKAAKVNGYIKDFNRYTTN